MAKFTNTAGTPSSSYHLPCMGTTEVSSGNCYGSGFNLAGGSSFPSNPSGNERMIYPTKVAFGKMCIPTMTEATKSLSAMAVIKAQVEAITSAIGFVMSLIDDLSEASNFIIGCLFLAMALGLIWMIIIQLLAACIVWTMILGTILAFNGLTYFIYTKA